MTDKSKIQIVNQITILAALLGVFFSASFPFSRALAYNVSMSQVFLNDPGFTLNVQDIDKQWGLVKGGFVEAWEKTTGSTAVVVAVIDTGIDATHEDLQAINFVKGFDVISRKSIEGKTNSDDNGHGTLIAGILGATTNNQAGVVGTNWRISLMPIKALDQNGRGDTTKVAAGIVWAVDNGAQILNLSLGGIAFGHDPVLAEAIAYAFRKNAIIVSAAGNDSAIESTNLDISPVYPICEDNGLNMIIGVAASDQNDFKANFSNYGKNCIDVMAPGKRILSTINHDPITKIYSPNAYAYASGTSLATALVAGQAALLKSVYPFATNIQIRDRIITTAEPVDYLSLNQCGNSPCKGLLGSGRINVKRSLEAGIFDQSLLDGDVARETETGTVYLIAGGKKQLISSFVYNQRFLGSNVRNVTQKQMETLPAGPYATPLENTLVKVEKNRTIYIIKNGTKMPVLFSVFKQKGYKFSEVSTVSFAEFNSWIGGSFLIPKEGTIVKNPSGRNLYWAIGDTLRPINRQFIKNKGIAGFPQLVLSDKDIGGFAKGEKLY